MNEHNATEQAYKNGYKKGRAEAIKEFAKKMAEYIEREDPKADVEEVVHCVDCEYLMFSDMYGECGKAILGIVSPHDFCSRGQRRRKG